MWSYMHCPAPALCPRCSNLAVTFVNPYTYQTENDPLISLLSNRSTNTTYRIFSSRSYGALKKKRPHRITNVSTNDDKQSGN
ncbi:uncharacterized protein isoform X2 [Rhodnius prolixus]|uniref:uncharacterized protein isoform X2 n=1 Tax=Rhodnius prolixus TaxID=13249 RepID=UPI003D18926E